jgi:hypothetical protein
MKKWLILTFLALVLSGLLSACTTINQILHPTPAPPPYGENDTWAVKVISIKKYSAPKEFNCSECEPNEPKKGLSLQDRNSYINVTTQVINKTTEEQTVDEITIGLMLNTFTYGCGGLTVAGSDFCLPSGMIRDGKNYVNYGVKTESFKKHLSFPPNSPDGEVVDFIFIIRPASKYTDFYFDAISPLVIKKIRPLSVSTK